MRTVTVMEVKTHWATLLRCAERGETIAITRNGLTVAHMTPPSTNDPESRAAAVGRIL